MHCRNCRTSPKIVFWGEGSGVWSCSRKTPDLHWCNLKVSLEQETSSRLLDLLHKTTCIFSSTCGGDPSESSAPTQCRTHAGKSKNKQTNANSHTLPLQIQMGYSMSAGNSQERRGRQILCQNPCAKQGARLELCLIHWINRESRTQNQQC